MIEALEGDINTSTSSYTAWQHVPRPSPENTYFLDLNFKCVLLDFQSILLTCLLFYMHQKALSQGYLNIAVLISGNGSNLQAIIDVIASGILPTFPFVSAARAFSFFVSVHFCLAVIALPCHPCMPTSSFHDIELCCSHIAPQLMLVIPHHLLLPLLIFRSSGLLLVPFSFVNAWFFLSTRACASLTHSLRSPSHFIECLNFHVPSQLRLVVSYRVFLVSPFLHSYKLCYVPLTMLLPPRGRI